MSALRKYLLLASAGAICILLFIRFILLLDPAHAREVEAACLGMRPIDHNPALGPITLQARYKAMWQKHDSTGEWPSFPPAAEAPAFQLADASGNKISLDAFRDQIVIVNFWASWCGSCRSEKPTLDYIQDRYGGSGLRVLAAASDTNWGSVRSSMLGLDVKTGAQLAKEFKVDSPKLAKRFAAAPDGTFITKISSDRPAASAGLREFDQLLSVAGNTVHGQESADNVLRDAGEHVTVVVGRPEEQLKVTLRAKSPLYVLLDPPKDNGKLGAIAKSYGITAVPESFVIDRQGKIRHHYVNRRNWDGDVAVTCLRALLDE